MDTLPSLALQVDSGLTLAYQLREEASQRLTNTWERPERRQALQQWALAAQVHAAYVLAAAQLMHNQVVSDYIETPPAPPARLIHEGA